MKVSADQNRVETDDGRVFVAVPCGVYGCEQCAFQDTEQCLTALCIAGNRRDGKPKIFKEIKQEIKKIPLDERAHRAIARHKKHCEKYHAAKRKVEQAWKEAAKMMAEFPPEPMTTTPPMLVINDPQHKPLTFRQALAIAIAGNVAVSYSGSTSKAVNTWAREVWMFADAVIAAEGCEGGEE